MSTSKKGEQSTRALHIPKEDEPEADGEFKIDFSTFVMSIATGVAFNLGLTPHPDSGEVVIDLLMAKHNIDILLMLEEKTRGNLSDAEGRLMQTLLIDLKMQFTKCSAKAR